LNSVRERERKTSRKRERKGNVENDRRIGRVFFFFFDLILSPALQNTSRFKGIRSLNEKESGYEKKGSKRKL